MFSTDDYPKWIATFEKGLNHSQLEDCIVEDDELWSHVRELKEIPHVANEWMELLFNRLSVRIYELYDDLFTVEYNVNAMDSSFNVDGISYTSSKELLNALKGVDNDVTYFNKHDAMGNVIACIHIDNDTTVSVIKEADNKYAAYLQDEDTLLDKLWVKDTKPTEEFLEAYDFNTDL